MSNAGLRREESEWRGEAARRNELDAGLNEKAAENGENRAGTDEKTKTEVETGIDRQ